MTIAKLPLTKFDHTPILSLNHLARVLKEDKDVIFTIAQTAPDYYEPFDRFKKKDQEGREHWRHIDNPTGALKEMQDKINRYILPKIVEALPDYLAGGMPGRSVVKNAYPHIGKELIVGMDLEKCFENVGHRQVYAVWRALGYGRDVSSVLTKLTTVQNRLPQGSPASTILCNLALSEMATEINEVAGRSSCDFTLYIDDVTISGEKDTTTQAIGDVMACIKRSSMKVNRKKTHLAYSNRTQDVTGVNVNKSKSVPSAKYEKARASIIALSKETQPVNVRLYQSVWRQVHHVVYIDKVKGRKLVKLAKEKLAHIQTFDGPKLKSVRTRSCKSVRHSHVTTL